MLDDLEERRSNEHSESKDEIQFRNLGDSKSDGNRARESSSDVRRSHSSVSFPTAPTAHVARNRSGLILQKTRGMIEGIQQSSDRARHEIYETQKLLGGKENGGAV